MRTLSSAEQDPDAYLVSELRKGNFPDHLIADLILRVKEYVWQNHAPMRRDAEDLAGRAVWVAYDRLETFRGDSRFETWVIGIVKKLILKAASKSRGKPEQIAIEDELERAEQELARSNNAAYAHSQSEERQLLAWEIEAEIAALPERDRRIFELVVNDEMTSGEVAREVGETASNVRQIHLRNCRRIKKRLEACGCEHYRPAPTIPAGGVAKQQAQTSTAVTSKTSGTRP